MQLKNSATHFGVVTILLHWFMAFLMIALIVLGIDMVDLPIGLEKLKLYGWHKEWGVLILMLAIIRIFWRITNISPSLATLTLLERIAARTVHWIFYGLMFALPISGWLLTSAAGLPVSFFGLFILPDLISPDENKRILFTTIHQWLAYGLIVIICLHTLAALKHHFINKDDILRRMLS